MKISCDGGLLKKSISENFTEVVVIVMVLRLFSHVCVPKVGLFVTVIGQDLKLKRNTLS